MAPDVDLESRAVTFDGRRIALLVEHPGRVFSREELLNVVR